MTDFIEFAKIARLSRRCVITEKLDGTNAQISINEDSTQIRAGSRNRWIDVGNDNYGFARWVEDHKDELIKLGPGRHYGEWWGLGIQRRYLVPEKRFSLFNTGIWNDETKPACCHVVPILFDGIFSTDAVETAIEHLQEHGSVASPGFKQPEGVIIYHIAKNCYFKKTLENDHEHKGPQS